MTMTDKDRLEPFFEAARTERAEPNDAFLARLAADAAAVTAERGAPVVRSAPASPLRRMLEAIGGWPSVAGLATATAAGIWIGVAVPDLTTNFVPLSSETTAFELVDLVPGYGDFIAEEG